MLFFDIYFSKFIYINLLNCFQGLLFFLNQLYLELIEKVTHIF